MGDSLQEKFAEVEKELDNLSSDYKDISIEICYKIDIAKSILNKNNNDNDNFDYEIAFLLIFSCFNELVLLKIKSGIGPYVTEVLTLIPKLAKDTIHNLANSKQNLYQINNINAVFLKSGIKIFEDHAQKYSRPKKYYNTNKIIDDFLDKKFYNFSETRNKLRITHGIKNNLLSDIECILIGLTIANKKIEGKNIRDLLSLLATGISLVNK